MERLKLLRTEAHKTQKEMADFLQIDRTTYVKYEAGFNEPTFASLLKLAEYFDVSIDYLLGRTEIRNAVKTEKPTVNDDGLRAKVVNLLVDLSPADLQRVVDFVAGLKASRTKDATQQG